MLMRRSDPLAYNKPLLLMLRKTKRQKQVSKIPRKKGRYISKDQAETEIEAVEGEKWMDNENIDEWKEGGIVEDQIEDELNND